MSQAKNYLLNSLISRFNITDFDELQDIMQLDVFTNDQETNPLLPYLYESCIQNEQWIKWADAYHTDPGINNRAKQLEYVNSEYVQNIITNMLNDGVNPEYLSTDPSATNFVLSTSYRIQYPYCNGLDLPFSNETWEAIVNLSLNRIDVFGGNGVTVVEQLQQLVQQQHLNCCLLPASFKNPRQVLEVLQAGVGAITLPVGIMGQMVSHPAIPLAVEQFNTDWQQVFGDKLAFET